ncbi:MAG: GNAT family N-acetyltransferase [Sneathiella sp.]|nr:GNAT family N-acetyltransferase [Sneathiella sp.]
MIYSNVYFDTPAAAKLLSQLHSLCFSKAWSEKDFSDLLVLSGTTAQVIDLNETPSAFCLYQRAREDAEILTLGVIPAARGQALGQLMLSHGIGHLKTAGVTRVFLEVSETNASARKLYKNSEFLEVGIRKNYYKEGDNRTHAIVMEKKVT